MARRRLAAALVAVVVAVPLASAAGAADPPKACALLKRTDIEPVVGAPTTKFAEKQPTPKSATVCNWDVGAPASGALVSVWAQRGKAAKQGYKQALRLYADDSEQIDDIAGQAFYAPRAGTVYVLDGSTLLFVQRLDATGATDAVALRDQAVELAGLALERL
jgi:hypothetical protein